MWCFNDITLDSISWDIDILSTIHIPVGLISSLIIDDFCLNIEGEMCLPNIKIKRDFIDLKPLNIAVTGSQ